MNLIRSSSKILTRIMVLALRFYARFISPLFPPSCRYYPSCSAYAESAVRTHGPIRGCWLAARRLLRCNPFASGGYDPVPEKD